MLDTKGPEIRTGDVKTPIKIKKGDKIIITPNFVNAKTSEKISVNYDFLAKDVEIGEKILVDNGVMNFRVIDKNQKEVTVEVLDGGELKSRRHLNLPGKDVSLESITEKD
jgi:pyruvate kinase